MLHTFFEGNFNHRIQHFSMHGLLDMDDPVPGKNIPAPDEAPETDPSPGTPPGPELQQFDMEQEEEKRTADKGKDDPDRTLMPDLDTPEDPKPRMPLSGEAGIH